MLTAEERQAIDEAAGQYPQRPAAGIEALKIVQRYRHWISDETLADIAAYLGMSPDELDNVATFYNLIFREPVGQHVIHICDSITCWIMGYEGLREHLCRRLEVDLGGTTGDGRFTLLPIQCLGTCDHAPAMMVDDDLHRDLDPSKLDQVLQHYAEGSD